MRLIISQQQIQHIDGRAAGDVYPFFHKRYNKVSCGFSTAHGIVPNKDYRRFYRGNSVFYLFQQNTGQKKGGT